MNRKLFLFVCGLLLLIGLTPVLSAEGVEDINLVRSRFFIDQAVFADSSTNRIEIYYKVFNDGLSYVKKGDKYVANYEVNVIILGRKSKQVTGKSVEKSYVLDDYESTRSESGFLVNQLSLPLAPGDYTLVCKLIDRNSNEVSTIETKINCYSFNRGGDISGIEFIQDASELAGQAQFSKGEVIALPKVERSFDSEGEKLGIYLEVYAAGYLGQKLQLKYVAEGKGDTSKIEGAIPLAIDSSVTRVREALNLVGLEPGEHDLRFSLVQDGKEVAQRSTRFLLKWSLSSLIKNDFEYAVEQLKYLITKEDKKSLLDAPDSLREKLFEDWWKKHDPTPTAPGNELRDEYYRRIRYADQYFTTVGREGWETDRGMVYIKYGEPDQIDRHPYEVDSKPYQIWYYYTLKRTFVFEDTHGDSDFQLKPPYDGDWRKSISP